MKDQGLSKSKPSAKSPSISFHEGDSPILPPQTTKKNRLSKYIELYRLQIFWTTLYTIIVFSIFAERAYGKFYIFRL